jgi:hypothetical protein
VSHASIQKEGWGPHCEGPESGRLARTASYKGQEPQGQNSQAEAMLYVVVISARSACHQEGASRPAGRTPASQYMHGGVNRLTGFPGRGPGDRARKRASVPAPSREASVGIATGGAVKMGRGVESYGLPPGPSQTFAVHSSNYLPQT